jgi:hypothetical protein
MNKCIEISLYHVNIKFPRNSNATVTQSPAGASAEDSDTVIPCPLFRAGVGRMRSATNPAGRALPPARHHRGVKDEAPE